MANIKKVRPIRINVIDKSEVFAAMAIKIKRESHLSFALTQELEKQFLSVYKHSWREVIDEVWKWQAYFPALDGSEASKETIYQIYVNCISSTETKPMLVAGVGADFEILYNFVVFKGYVYEWNRTFTYEQIRLLVLEDFDKERKYFEKLKTKFDENPNTISTYERPRIPENVRIEVWRRDSGKCARCGSREKLEYDHIVPISKGGSNTARNIELLCEKCNRSKSNNVV